MLSLSCKRYTKTVKKDTATEMKNAFDELVIIRLDMAEERIAELEDLSIETSKIKTK